MDLLFRRAVVPEGLRSLVIFDRKAFHEYPADWFDHNAWMSFESWWMLAGRRKIGCCAFDRSLSRRSLYVVSSGILPAFQGQGFGSALKRWQVSYARRRGYTRIVTNTRRSNTAMIRLNQKFGFTILRTLPNYYEAPPEASVVMQLLLPRPARRHG